MNHFSDKKSTDQYKETLQKPSESPQAKLTSRAYGHWEGKLREENARINNDNTQLLKSQQEVNQAFERAIRERIARLEVKNRVPAALKNIDLDSAHLREIEVHMMRASGTIAGDGPKLHYTSLGRQIPIIRRMSASILSPMDEEAWLQRVGFAGKVNRVQFPSSTDYTTAVVRKMDPLSLMSFRQAPA